MNLYTSDLHFEHKNVIQFDHRPFSNVEEMDAFIMQCWNKLQMAHPNGQFCGAKRSRCVAERSDVVRF